MGIVLEEIRQLDKKDVAWRDQAHRLVLGHNQSPIGDSHISPHDLVFRFRTRTIYDVFTRELKHGEFEDPELEALNEAKEAKWRRMQRERTAAGAGANVQGWGLGDAGN